MKSRVVVIAMFAVAVGGGAYLYVREPATGRDTPPIASADFAGDVMASFDPSVRYPAKPTMAQPPDGEDASQAALKYRYLLSDWRGGNGVRREVIRLLAERERLVRMSNATEIEMESPEARLGAIDDELRSLLSPAEYYAYELLKESDAEQRRLSDYAAGAGDVAPLMADQERALLEAKLQHKQRFDAIVRDSGLYRDDVLSDAERSHVRATIEQALQEYKENYLREARLHLADDEQYALLSNYEATEFQREQERLRFMLDSK